jgi:hypothetical protein
MKPLDQAGATHKLRVEEHRLKGALDRFYNHEDFSRNQTGLEAAVLEIATPIRVIVHDTGGSSVSLLNQVDSGYLDKLIHFAPLIAPPSRILPSGQRTMTSVIPINVSFGVGKTVFIRYKGCKGTEKKVPLAEWWNAPCWDSGSNQISNKDIVLAIANKEGGAHVDGDVSAKYTSAKDQGKIIVGGRPVNDVVRLGNLVGIAGDELLEYLADHFPAVAEQRE